MKLSFAFAVSVTIDISINSPLHSCLEKDLHDVYHKTKDDVLVLAIALHISNFARRLPSPPDKTMLPELLPNQRDFFRGCSTADGSARQLATDTIKQYDELEHQDDLAITMIQVVLYMVLVEPCLRNDMIDFYDRSAIHIPTCRLDD